MNLSKRLAITLACALVAAAAGCRSASSFFMQRFDDDRIAAHSNGTSGIHGNAKPFKGIPVTLKVATHVDIQIVETIYLDANTFDVIKTNRRNLHAEATPVYSDKIFAVDPKRAAAGQTNYTFDMNDGHPDPRQQQYFKQIKQTIEDETLRDVTTALDGLLPLLGPAASAADDKGLAAFDREDSPVVPKQRIVAWKRFDINNPDFECEVRAFVDEHLNNCSPACGIGDASPIFPQP